MRRYRLKTHREIVNEFGNNYKQVITDIGPLSFIDTMERYLGHRLSEHESNEVEGSTCGTVFIEFSDEISMYFNIETMITLEKDG